MRLPPTWALAIGAAAVAAAAIRLVWSFASSKPADSLESRLPEALPPLPPLPEATPPPPLPEVSLPDAAVPPPAPAPAAAEAASSARAVVHEAAEHLAASAGGSAEAVAAAMGPLLLAAETAGAADETAFLSLEELQTMATELYMLIQQMEMQVQELIGDLVGVLPPSSQTRLDELAGEVEELEELMAALKVQDDEGVVQAIQEAERTYEQLLWRQFEVVSEGAADGERRTYRSLLFNLSTQRQLLRQVEQQEAMQLRMRQMQQQMEALLAAEQQQQQAEAAASSTEASGGGDSSDSGGAGPAAGQQVPEPAAEVAAARAPVAPPPLLPPMGAPTAAAGAAAEAVAPAAPAAATAAAQLRLVAAGVMMPHPAKAHTGGEDAFFISSCGQGAIGVADGVGGWAAEGIDPSLYPRRLMIACKEALQAAEVQGASSSAGSSSSEGSSSDVGNDAEAAAAMEALIGDSAAVALLEAAHSVSKEPGSCAVIIAVLLGGSRLSLANLGDCELKVVRGGEVAYASQILEHQWNMPYQLSCPDFYDCGSRPSSSHQEVLDLQAGDVLVMGSDGLFDNLWDDQILEMVGEQQGAGASSAQDMVQQLAQQLAATAHRQSTDAGFVSPFAVERHERAASEIRMEVPRHGGKTDDVTVVVAFLE